MIDSIVPPRRALEERLGGTPLVLMLDVDGTLAPIAEHPSLAVVPPETRRVVAALASRETVHVALVSGRAAVDARRMVAVARVWTVGNHGAEVIDPDGVTTVDPAIEPYAPSMARVARALEPLLASLSRVVLEDKRWTLSVHYRMADPAIVPRLRLVVEEVVKRHGLRITEGKCVLEIRPPVRLDKGVAVVHLADRLGALDPAASLLFAGDDATDEDAFRLLRERAPGAVTIRIGSPDPATAAEYALAGPRDLQSLLERLAHQR